ncbi:MAG: phage tail assembly chaperone [Saprospiraceae bacterium]
MYTHSEYADPDPMDADGYLIPPNATMTAPPDFERGETARWDGERWKTEPDNTEVERHAAFQRSARNYLLAASDWTQLPDAPLSLETRQAWAIYRQRLRDITALPGWPFVTMPAPPDGSGRA